MFPGWAPISESTYDALLAERITRASVSRCARTGGSSQATQVRNSSGSSGIQHESKATVSPGCYHGCGRTQDGRGLGETASQPWAGVERLTRNSIKATRKEYLLSSVHSATCDECRNLPSRVLLCSCFTYIMTASRGQPGMQTNILLR